MCDSTNFASRPDTPDESLLYEYIGLLVIQEPGSAIKAFFNFFYEGTIMPYGMSPASGQKYRSALKRIISGDKTRPNFKFILNRSIHILWNRWSHESSRRKALLHLTNRFTHLPDIPSRNDFISALRAEMRAFVSKPQYKALQRRIRLWDEYTITDKDVYVLGDLLKDYHCIYRPTMITNDLRIEDCEDILRFHRKKVVQFEKYLRYFLHHQTTPGSRSVPNKTKLSDINLVKSIQHFDPELPESYREESHNFNSRRSSIKTVGDFKREFFIYLLKTVTVIDGHEDLPNNHFAKRLQECIDSIRGIDHMSFNSAIATLICKRVLDFLIADTMQQADSGTLQELTEKVGYLKTIGLLVKIALFRKAMTPWLEKRFGILFDLNESEEVTEVEWLVQTFEHLNVALTLNAKDVGYYSNQAVA